MRTADASATGHARNRQPACRGWDVTAATDVIAAHGVATAPGVAAACGITGARPGRRTP